MSNTAHYFKLPVTSAGYTYQELKINIDGSTPPAGQKKRLYDLPNSLKLVNSGIKDIFVRWMNQAEGNGDSGDWNGIILEAGAGIIIQGLKGIDRPLYKVGAKLDGAGSGELKISVIDYVNIFE